MWRSEGYGSVVRLRRCAGSTPANQPADDKSRGGCGDAERGATGVGRDRPRRRTTGARRSLDAIACPLRRDLRIVSLPSGRVCDFIKTKMTGPVFSYWQFGGRNESGRQGQESPQRPWEDSKMAPFARTAAVLTGAAMLAAAPFLAGPALAQADYPSRPVELIVTFGPGGGSDVMGRQIARQLEPLLEVSRSEEQTYELQSIMRIPYA